MAELFFNDRRIDGRKTTELRKIDCFFLPGMADGSVLLQQGNTKVTASVFGPHPCKLRSDESPEEVYVTCRYNRPPFTSTSGNRQKQTSSDRAAAEYSITIEEIFSTLIRGSVYPMAQIDIFIEVLQSDGSEFSTAINAASLALATAGIEMVDFAVASTVGESVLVLTETVSFFHCYYGSRLFADLCRYEENSRITQVTIVCLPASAAAKTDSMAAAAAVAEHAD
ncbi:unnamed protein product, partial [Dibothriocephalus latus]